MKVDDLIKSCICISGGRYFRGVWSATLDVFLQSRTCVFRSLVFSRGLACCYWWRLRSCS